MSNSVLPKEVQKRLYCLHLEVTPDIVRDIENCLVSEFKKLQEKLNFEQLRNANVERCVNSFKHSIEDWSPSDWAMATTGELGELCNLLIKAHRGEVISQQDITDEIADTAIYLDLLAARLGIDLGEAVRHKFNIVSERVSSPVKI